MEKEKFFMVEGSRFALEQNQVRQQDAKCPTGFSFAIHDRFPMRFLDRIALALFPYSCCISSLLPHFRGKTTRDRHFLVQ
jgi:hypothetical protein